MKTKGTKLNTSFVVEDIPYERKRMSKSIPIENFPKMSDGQSFVYFTGNAYECQKIYSRLFSYFKRHDLPYKITNRKNSQGSYEIRIYKVK